MNRALALVLLASCAAAPPHDRPLASRLWFHAYEICGTDAPWDACLDALAEDPDARKEGDARSTRELRHAAELVCTAEDDWQACFARLDPASVLGTPAPQPATSSATEPPAGNH